MQEVFGLIERIAPSNVSVLITGESGTGKELVARTLHDLSDRKNRPFVAVNCAAIPETLMESEIFGHEKGAFTGAVERRAGCLSWPRKARCCSTNWARCRSGRRPSCCGCWRSASCAGWGAQRAGRGCARAGRHQPQSRGCRRRRPVALRSLLPPERLSHSHAAACAITQRIFRIWSRPCSRR
jgi:hypothetical protein